MKSFSAIFSIHYVVASSFIERPVDTSVWSRRCYPFWRECTRTARIRRSRDCCSCRMRSLLRRWGRGSLSPSAAGRSLGTHFIARVYIPQRSAEYFARSCALGDDTAVPRCFMYLSLAPRQFFPGLVLRSLSRRESAEQSSFDDPSVFL